MAINLPKGTISNKHPHKKLNKNHHQNSQSALTSRTRRAAPLNLLADDDAYQDQLNHQKHHRNEARSFANIDL